MRVLCENKGRWGVSSFCTAPVAPHGLVVAWLQLVELALPMSEAMTTIYHAIAELLGACIKACSPGNVERVATTIFDICWIGRLHIRVFGFKAVFQAEELHQSVKEEIHRALLLAPREAGVSNAFVIKASTCLSTTRHRHVLLRRSGGQAAQAT